jgi:hypothetical protein
MFGKMIEHQFRARLECEACVLGTRSNSNEELEAWRVRYQVCTAIFTNTLLRLKHAVEMERHPLLAQHIVQTLPVRSSILDFEYKSRPSMVLGCLAHRTLRGMLLGF